jgi:hypothetical protein
LTYLQKNQLPDHPLVCSNSLLFRGLKHLSTSQNSWRLFVLPFKLRCLE